MNTKLEIDWVKQKVCLTQLPLRMKLPRLVFEVSIGNIKFTGEKLMFVLPTDRTAKVAVIGTDVKGHPTKEFENLTFSSSDESIATVDNEGRITPINPSPEGAVMTINAQADGIVGEEEALIFGTMEMMVAPSQAVSLGLSATLE